MATVQTDGTSSVTSNSTINNGGTAVRTGTSSSLLDNIYSSEARTQYGSTPVDNNDADRAVTTVAFAKNNSGLLAKRVNSGLPNGVVLRSGASVPSLTKSINRLEGLVTRLQTKAYREGKFNDFTGKFDAGYPQQSDDSSMLYDGSTYEDRAADVSRSAPGSLRFMYGSSSVSKNYSPKTS